MDDDPINKGLGQGAMFVVYVLIIAFLLFVWFAAVLGMWELVLWMVENYGVSKWEFWRQ